MKDFSGVVPFKFILRRLQNGLGAKVKDFSGSIPFKFLLRRLKVDKKMKNFSGGFTVQIS